MRRRRVNTKEDVVEAVKSLAGHFGIPMPRIEWGTGRRSRAWPIQNRIRISVNSWQSTGNATLNEFAHLLAWHRSRTLAHGWTFYTTLLSVATAWYKDPQLYAWHKEYFRIHQFSYARETRHGARWQRPLPGITALGVCGSKAPAPIRKGSIR